MATRTEHFNLIKPEGTDLWNPLTLENPAIDAIDAQMYVNQNNAITTGIHTKEGTVHNIQRVISTVPVIRFFATDDFNAGDTISIDGTVVSARFPDGSGLTSGAFKINSNVIVVYNGGIATFVTSKPVDATLSTTSTNAIANNVVTAEINSNKERIDSAESLIGNNDISSVGDGTVTGAISNMNTTLTKNYALGSPTALTVNTNYTCPSDGYFIISIRYGHAGETVTGFIGNQSISSVVGEQSNSRLVSIFVKKGMVIHFTTTGEFGVGQFISIV